METFGFFDPIAYAFRTFFKHIWLMLLCLLAIFGLGFLMVFLLTAINWPIINYFTQMIMKAHQAAPQMAGMMGNIDAMNGAGMMGGMGLPAMGPEMMKGLVLKFLPYLIASAIITSVFGTWVWAGVCAVALELRDKGSGSVKTLFTAIRFVPKVWLSYVLWGIPLFGIFFLVIYGAGMMTLGGLMRLGGVPFQLILILFVFLAFLPIMFTNFYIIDKKSGPVAALMSSFSLTRSGGFKAYGALFLLMVLLFLFGCIPVLGNYIGLLLVALGLSYMYRKLGA